MGQNVWIMAGNTKLITANTPYPETEDFSDDDIDMDEEDHNVEELP
jgi:hypothetical protein